MIVMMSFGFHEGFLQHGNVPSSAREVRLDLCPVAFLHATEKALLIILGQALSDRRGRGLHRVDRQLDLDGVKVSLDQGHAQPYRVLRGRKS
jgi:hypothetical protein